MLILIYTFSGRIYIGVISNAHLPAREQHEGLHI
jgi:hypothetical protein